MNQFSEFNSKLLYHLIVMINSSGFITFHNSSKFLVKLSQFFFHILSFLSFIKLLFFFDGWLVSKRRYNDFFLDMLNTVNNNFLWFFLHRLILLIIWIWFRSFNCSPCLLWFGYNFVLLLKLMNHFGLLESESTLISLNLRLLIGFICFSAVVTLSKFSVVKRTFHCKGYNLNIRFSFFICLLKRIKLFLRTLYFPKAFEIL